MTLYANRSDISLEEESESTYGNPVAVEWHARYTGFLEDASGDEREYVDSFTRSGATAAEAVANLEEAMKEQDWVVR